MTEEKLQELENDPKFRERLQRETEDLLVSRTRLAVTITVFMWPAFWLLDRTVSPENATAFLWLRLSLWPFLVATYVVLGFPAGRRLAVHVSVGIVTIASLNMSLMMPMLGGFRSDYYNGLLMAFLVIGTYMPWDLAPTVVGGLLILLGYFGVNLLVAPESATTAQAFLRPVFFLGGSYLFTIFANGSKERTRRRDLVLRMQIEKANEELKKLDEAKTRFFSNVSHELRTPLTLILGPIESMLQGRECAPPRALLEAMASNARRLLRQVNAILDFAKLDAGKLTLNLVEDNLGRVLAELVSAAKPHAERRRITLVGENLEGLPESVFDPDRVETIAANLISNAVKFTPDGGRIVVRAGAEESQIWFEVEDSGAGIPEDQLSTIFERFRQVDDSLSRKTEGTGLGLAMVWELTRLHKGKVTVHSRVGAGSTFRVELPMYPDVAGVNHQPESGRQREDPAAEARAQALAGMQFQRRSGALTLLADVDGAKLEDGAADEAAATAPEDAPRILLVEDNPDLRAFVSRALARNYRVRTARDGLEGLEEARRETPDLIVSDVMMPRMDGYELCRRLRQDESLLRVPVILVTAKSGTEAVVEGLDVGADDYVTKPFEMRELEARVAAHLRARALERNLSERETRLAAIGQMTGSIVHDLRNPMQAIIGFSEVAQLLAVQEGKKEVAEALNPVIDEAHRLGRMITEVLDFAKGGSTRLERTPTVLRDFLEAIAGPQRDRLSGYRIALILEHDPDPTLSLDLDRDRMQRVIENLVKNAREALVAARQGGEQKHIWITTRADEEVVTIRVADDGPGIPEDVVDRLFQPFATSGKVHGTGLGLATVRNLVKAHGGEVHAEATCEKGGAAFVMTFPRQLGVPVEATPLPAYASA